MSEENEDYEDGSEIEPDLMEIKRSNYHRLLVATMVRLKTMNEMSGDERDGLIKLSEYLKFVLVMIATVNHSKN